jgi:CBS domain-containing protein
MQKMLQRDIRHLPLLDDGGKVIGMLSVKDLVKTLVQEKEDTIKVLSDFALGKGGHFGSE